MSLQNQNEFLNHIEQNMANIAPHRNPTLFRKFLVQGYTATTLSSISKADFSEVLRAKICLGTMITLFDDFADRPTQKDPHLLNTLYQFNFSRAHFQGNINLSNNRVTTFAKSLFTEMYNILSRQPNYSTFLELLNFDLSQFYSANQYSYLITSFPQINNLMENRLYSHHNMGMVLSGMIDLVSSNGIVLSELGLIRSVFLMGQRLGRIFNVLYTHRREILDCDQTGELSAFPKSLSVETARLLLERECEILFRRIRKVENCITTFSVNSYVDGLLEVQKLYQQLEGII